MDAWKLLILEKKQELINLGLACEVLANDRDMVLRELGSPVLGKVPRNEVAYQDLLEIFNTISSYDVWATFLRVLKFLEQGSPAFIAFEDRVRNLGLVSSKRMDFNNPEGNLFTGITVYRIGRGKTLGQIGAVVATWLRSMKPSVGIVLFQADIELDKTESFLLRLKEDPKGMHYRLPKVATVWDNWDEEKRVEMTNCYIRSRRDPEGGKRSDWCLSEINQRIIDSQPDVSVSLNENVFLNLKESVGAIDFSHYMLLHTISTAVAESDIKKYLIQYLRKWRQVPLQMPDLKNRAGEKVSFFLLFHVQVDRSDSAARAQWTEIRREIYAEVAGNTERVELEEDDSILDLTGQSVDHLLHLEDIQRNEVRLWIEGFVKDVEKARRIGEVAGAVAQELTDEAEGLTEALFSTKTTLPMGEIEPRLLRLVRDFDAKRGTRVR